jgi:hypothetical protein
LAIGWQVDAVAYQPIANRLQEISDAKIAGRTISNWLEGRRTGLPVISPKDYNPLA